MTHFSGVSDFKNFCILICIFIFYFLFFILDFPKGVQRPTYAANLSIDIGKGSTSVAAGRDFGFGYGMLGVSATFTTDAPWSYVSTKEGLDDACTDFQSEPTRDCELKGHFQDGDEWEVFSKLGYRLPLLSIFYINTGIGVSKQRVTDLYLFCDEIKVIPTEPKGCSKAGEFLTWGQIKEHYYANFLAGVSVEMTRRFLLNIDYHTRKGLLGGLMWRF